MLLAIVDMPVWKVFFLVLMSNILLSSVMLDWPTWVFLHLHNVLCFEICCSIEQRNEGCIQLIVGCKKNLTSHKVKTWGCFERKKYLLTCTKNLTKPNFDTALRKRGKKMFDPSYTGFGLGKWWQARKNYIYVTSMGWKRTRLLHYRNRDDSKLSSWDLLNIKNNR